jgi:hypothetical protein
LSTAGFDPLLLAPDGICACLSLSDARLWAILAGNLANVGSGEG